MGSSQKSVFPLAASLIMAGVLASAATANVNLEWRMPRTVLRVGETIEAGLYAVSDDETDQSFTALAVILAWDPLALRLDGKDDNGVSWGSSSFPPDGCLDQLNFGCCPAPDPCVPAYAALPENDGDALYQSFLFSGSIDATPEGVLVTTIVFTALAPTEETELRILAQFGSETETWVLNGPAGRPTGSLGSVALLIAACGTRGDFDGDCRVTWQEDWDPQSVCLEGPGVGPIPPECDFADFTGDEIVDMRDVAAFQREFTGP